MIIKPDFDFIKAQYEANYKRCLDDGTFRLKIHDYDWMRNLNDVQFNIYQDIVGEGIKLFPLYPIEDIYFIDFGNPFSRFGIEILYKNYGIKEKQEKINYLISIGWTIFTIDSKNTYMNEEDFYNSKKSNDSKQYYELSAEELNTFATKYKNENSSCLINYLKMNYYNQIFSVKM